MTPQPLLGLFLHALGGVAAASFYAPHRLGKRHGRIRGRSLIRSYDPTRSVLAMIETAKNTPAA